MDPAVAPTLAPEIGVFRDGLGERRCIVDPTASATLEILRLRDELTSVPSFEFALRERLSRLASFQQQNFGRALSVDRMNDRGSATLALVSEYTPGVRLADLLAVAELQRLPLDVNAALCLIRQLVPAMAALHENARDVAHGAIGAERIVITPTGRLVVLEYVLGSALEQLRFSHERYWKEMGVALPRSAGLPRFDQRADVLQIGIVALSLILGRPLHEDEYPARTGEVLGSAWAICAGGGYEPLPPGLRAWLARALQLDLRNSFMSAAEARAELDKVMGDSKSVAGPAALSAFLSEYRAKLAEFPAPAMPAPVPPILVALSEGHQPEASTESPRGPRAAQPESAPAKPLPAASAVAREALRPASVPVPVVTPAPIVVPAPAVTTVAPVHAVIPEALAQPPSVAAGIPIGLKTEDSSPGSSWPTESERAEADSDRMTTSQPVPPQPVRSTSQLALDPGSVASELAPSRRWSVVATGAAVVFLLAAVGILGGRRLTAPADTGTLSVNTNPTGAQVLVDGEARGVTPISLKLKVGAHQVQLRGPGEPRLISVMISPGAEVSQYIELPKGGSPVGQLHVRTDPAGARVSVDGVSRGVSPLTIRGLSPGEHAVVLENDLGSVKQTVTIESGTTASLVVPLAAPEGAPVSGWITVTAPAPVEVYEKKRLIGTSQSDRLMVSTGAHEVEIVNDTLGYRVLRTVQVLPGKVATIKVDFPKTSIDINAVPWADVWIDGDKVGETPMGNFPITIGTHDILFRNPDLGDERRTVTVTLRSPARLSVDLRKK